MAGRAPIDVGCPLCGVLPGDRCHSMVITGRPMLRRPHAERVLAARRTEERRQRPTVPAGVTDAWTCPTCVHSYWPPKEWESEVWPAIRRELQALHAVRHRAETASHQGGAEE